MPKFAEEGFNSEGENNQVDDVISRQEVYFTGKENIEGYSALVTVFLSQMIKSSYHPALINIDNEESSNGSSES